VGWASKAQEHKSKCTRYSGTYHGARRAQYSASMVVLVITDGA